MLELDHLLWATPDLDAGVDLIRSLTGVASARGGSHPAWGTRNSLLALGAGVYLEIIGPDEEQDLNGKVGARMAALPRAGLTRFAVRTNDLLRLRETAKAAGLGTEGPFGMHRDRPDGVRLAWSMLMLSHAAYG